MLMVPGALLPRQPRPLGGGHDRRTEADGRPNLSRPVHRGNPLRHVDAGQQPDTGAAEVEVAGDLRPRCSCGSSRAYDMGTVALTTHPRGPDPAAQRSAN